MPYFCSRPECGYIWDKRGRTDKRTRCPRCRSYKTLYLRHIDIKDIENFIKRRKRYLKDHPHIEKSKPEPGEEPIKTPTRPIIPTIKPPCWGKWKPQHHCKRKCPVRKSCRKEFKYQEYKGGD